MKTSLEIIEKKIILLFKEEEIAEQQHLNGNWIALTHTYTSLFLSFSVSVTPVLEVQHKKKWACVSACAFKVQISPIENTSVFFLG